MSEMSPSTRAASPTASAPNATADADLHGDAFVAEVQAAWESLSPAERANLGDEARNAEERLRAFVAAGGDPNEFDPSA